jgi:hypothetical protein
LTSSVGSKTARRLRRYRNIRPTAGKSSIDDQQDKKGIHTSKFVPPIPGRFDCIELNRYLGEALTVLIYYTYHPGMLPLDGLDFFDRRHCDTGSGEE